MSEASDPVSRKESVATLRETFFWGEGGEGRKKRDNALRYRCFLPIPCRVARNVGASTITSILAAKTMALNLTECRGEELKSACV